MCQANNLMQTIAAHKQILHFPKGGKPALIPNEWLTLDQSADEGLSLDVPVEQKIIVPFSWWITHHQEAQVQAKIQQNQIAVWFAASDDILLHADLIEQGQSVWPLVAAHFPIFRDGRSFSTAALLRERFEWQGEIRAIGDVLIDQLLQGARVGFDSFALRPDQDLDVALKQFDLITMRMQNSWRGIRTTRTTLSA